MLLPAPNWPTSRKGLDLDAELKSRFTDIVREAEKKIPYASALVKKSRGLRANVNRVQESVEPEDPSLGLVITLFNGQTFYEHAVNTWEWDKLKQDILDLAGVAASRRDPSRLTFDVDPGTPLEKHFQGPASDASEKSTSDKLDLARESLQSALVDPQVANAVAMTGDRTTEDLFINRTRVISQSITRTEAMLMVFVTDGQKTCEVFDGVSKNGPYSKTKLKPAEIKLLVEDAKRLLTAPRLGPGTYDVVTDPEWSGIIAHECFGHGMETDLYVRERALSRRYLGQKIAAPIVTMKDDPSLLDEAGGFFFDDEGQLSSETVIIRDGLLQRGLTDLASASKLRMARSANGRRESFERKAYARMTNTFFENGQSTKEEMIGSVKDGLYLRYATNGMEDPQAWGIQVEGLWAEEIKNGKLTGKIYSPVIMTGFVPELLGSISMVGNDRWISGLGMCGKGHKEWVKNTTGGPHLKMRARLA